MIWPMAATVATMEPVRVPKSAQVAMPTAPQEARNRPTKELMNLNRPSASREYCMMYPAKTKKGMASRSKLSRLENAEPARLFRAKPWVTKVTEAAMPREYASGNSMIMASPRKMTRKSRNASIFCPPLRLSFHRRFHLNGACQLADLNEHLQE